MGVGAEMNVLQEVTQIVESTLKIPSGELDINAEFESFGVDSIVAMELISNLSKSLGISITPAQFTNVNTVKDLSDYIQEYFFSDKDKTVEAPTPQNSEKTESGDVKTSDKQSTGAVTTSHSKDEKEAINNVRERRRSSQRRDAFRASRRTSRGASRTQIQELVHYVNQKYSINLSSVGLTSADQVADVLVSNHLEDLLMHYNLSSAVTASEPSISGVRENIGRNDNRIAIVGMACQFPDASSPSEFWNNLVSKKNSIQEVPRSRWNWEDNYSSTATPGKTVSRWGAFIDGVECFDAEFFGIDPNHAQFMDPQERLLCQETYRAFQDAGIAINSLSGSNTGVFIGYEYAEYEQYVRENLHNISGAPYYSSSSPTYYLANRVSFVFNLQGTSESINTNCASSAVAINRAYYALLNGEVDQAVVGGVSLNLFANDYVAASYYGMLSPTGTCAVFDNDANGFTRGEGLGVLVLKRVEDAQKDRNRIYSVIRSCFQNNRGMANDISEIKHESISKVLSSCYQRESIDPASVRYIEVDGYCTKWGDSFEFEGIKNSFSETDYQNRFGKHCALGSLKGNIGHLEPASAIAGVIKVAMSLYNNKFPATITKNTLSDFIDIESSTHPLYIADEDILLDSLRDGEGTPIRAGINSFSDSGSNVHILLEEWSEKPALKNEMDYGQQLFVLSAKSGSSLNDQIDKFIDFLSLDNDDSNFIDTIYTLQLGRDELNYRLALICENHKDLVEKLSLLRKSISNSDFNIVDSKLSDKGIFYGNTEQARNDAIFGSMTKELRQQLVTQNLLAEQWHELALLWVSGAEIPWQNIWTDNLANIISLPAYSFDKARCWVEVTEEKNTNDNSSVSAGLKIAHTGLNTVEATISGPSQIHPLLHQNISDLQSLRFRSMLNSNQAVVSDHQLAGNSVLPAAVVVEMIHAALCNVCPDIQLDSQFTLHDLVWAQPIELSDEGLLSIELDLLPQAENQFLFEISGSYDSGSYDNEKTVYCQGAASLTITSGSDALNRDKLNIVELKAQMEQGKMSSTIAYQTFLERGAHYGEFYRSIDVIYRGDGELIAELKLPTHLLSNSKEFAVHPSLFDGVLQSCLGLFTEGRGNSQQFSLPSQIDAIQIYSSLPERIFVWVRPSEGKTLNGDDLALDLAVTDNEGNLLVEISGVRYQFGALFDQSLAQEKWLFSTDDEERETLSLSVEEKIELFLKQEVSSQTQQSISAIADDKNYFELGMASLGIANLVQKTNHLLNERLSPSVVFEYSDIGKFVGYLVSNYREKIETINVTKIDVEVDAADKNIDNGIRKLHPFPKTSIWGNSTEKLSVGELLKRSEPSSESSLSEEKSKDLFKKKDNEIKEFPLSAGEKPLYILQRINPEVNAYNFPLCYKVGKKVNVDALEKAWDVLLQQFPILTSKFAEKEGELYHVVDGNSGSKVKHHNIDVADDEALLALLRKEAKAPFDLNNDPLSRIDLFLDEEMGYILLVTVHHIIFDGASATILLKHLFTYYQQLCMGLEVQIDESLGGYHEFVAWESEMLASEEGLQHASYWREQLSGDLPTFELLPDLPRLQSSTFEGTTLVEYLPEEMSDWVHAFSASESIPPSVIFLSVFQLLLYKYVNQTDFGSDDIIVGMPVMGRPEARFAEEIGYFVNMVPLRTHCGENIALRQFLKNVQRTMMDALYHSSYPFKLMVDNLDLQQVEKNPIFQVFYAYQNFIQQEDLMQQEALGIESVTGINQEGDFDLGLEVFENQKSHRIHIKYNPDIYTKETIEALFEHYCALFKEISHNPDNQIQAYSIITSNEKQLLLEDYNQTQAPYPKNVCVHHVFAEQVKKTPDAIAVIDEDRQVSYQELYDKSMQLGIYLQSLGVAPDDLVGLCFERSIDMMVALWGTLMSGAAYVPLDPDYPEDRLAHMLQDSNAKVVLTQQALKERVSGLANEGAHIISLDEQQEDIKNKVNGLREKGVLLNEEVKASNLAYIIYTSGSTGKPKGVMIEHASLVNLSVNEQGLFDIEESSIVLQFFSLCFDFSVSEIFVTLCAGGALCLIRKDNFVPNLFQNFLAKHEVTHAFLPPVMLSELDINNIPPKLKLLNVGGDVCPHLLALEWSKKLRVFNTYGPTESTVDTCYYEFQDGDNYKSSPIGIPIANTQTYILDKHGNPQPPGVPGELHIAGDGLARGYLNRVDLTQEKFISNPFDSGKRMYKSGDLVRWLPDGQIEYLGRIDTQIKIRGFRIEIGEIESQLNSHPEVKDSVVIVQGKDANKRLIAFYVSKNNKDDLFVEIPLEELRDHMQKSLPEYMRPAAFVNLHSLPATPNGKVDRRALAEMEVNIESSQTYVAPRNDIEKELVDIWAQILKLEPETIGIYDSFFELGGHSLLATQLISQIRARLDIDLPLKALFELTNITELGALIANTEKSEIPPIVAVDRAKLNSLPLSFAQERVWFVDQLEPGSIAYNITGAVLIKEELDVDQLQSAFNIVVSRHESLRTVFPEQNGQAKKLILNHVDFSLATHDVSQYKTKKTRKKKAEEFCRLEAEKSFDLAAGPLLRGCLIKLADQEHILVLSMHHIISDGWSVGVLISEVAHIWESLAKGEKPQLPELPIQYADYSVWQRNWLEDSEVLNKQLSYWKSKLDGVPESLDLVTDFPRSSTQSISGATQLFAVDAKLMQGLKDISDRQGSSLYMVLLSVFNVLLYRYTGKEDICIGSPIANRQYAGTESLIGMFVNTLALRNSIDGEESFSSLLESVKTTCLEAYENQDAPFEKVVDLVQPHRNMAISPLFQIMLVLHNTPLELVEQRIQPYVIDRGISQFELTFEFTETPNGLEGLVEYNTDLFKPETITNMIEHFTELCRSVVESPKQTIDSLNYISEVEIQKLQEFNHTEAEYPRDICIHQLFHEQVQRTPDKLAMSYGSEELSYKQLYDKSYELALYLQDQGVTPDSLVALCIDRSLEMMIGIWGILIAGGVYVPIDPDYPQDRLTHMFEDSQSPLILTESKLVEQLEPLVADKTKLILLDEQWEQITSVAASLQSQDKALNEAVTPENLAYVIYTSGSTGLPKGVMVEHRSLVNHNVYAVEKYGVSESDIQIQFSTMSFDLFIEEVFVALMSGAQLILEKKDDLLSLEYLKELIHARKISVLNVPTAFFHQLVASNIALDGIQRIIIGGEKLDYAKAKEFNERYPDICLFNTYGPTETTIISTALQVTKDVVDNYQSIPIGYPISNTQIYMLDKKGNLQARGVPGELHIAGDGLARGYLGRDDLTSEKFVENPFAPGTLMYRTGDLARFLEDGNIEYLGRVDTQVKIRGFRIEMGEIENQLNQLEGVKESVVVAQGRDGDKKLIAFYLPENLSADETKSNNDDKRASLQKILPEYMLPAAFVELDLIPLNPNGKVDRSVLERRIVEVKSTREYLAPRNDIEGSLVQIWSSLLNIASEKISVNDNFFELGGHSLLAVQLLSKIRAEFEIDIPLKSLFDVDSLTDISDLIQAILGQRAQHSSMEESNSDTDEEYEELLI